MRHRFAAVLARLTTLPAAALLAGLFGAVHDQFTFTLASEYFTHFKFLQFGIPWAFDAPRRDQAA